ncbi:MAG: indolepyruvate oxidoreductase subunit beta [Eggerthellaceae bacterium]|nr:indolepyruvate oxidoreductase subunit beta [Eggerthellaceae bacterium]
MSTEPITVLLCGVGGQGTILAADLLAHSAQAAGYEVKLSEVHGMAQRGGAVTTIVRFGEKVSAMVTDEGCADVVIAFETTEALRNISYLKADGKLLVNDETKKPLPVLTGKMEMPPDARGTLTKLGASLVPATKIAREIGNEKCSNVVLLGALANEVGIGKSFWEAQIETRLPARLTEINLTAFRAGFAYEEEAGLQ